MLAKMTVYYASHVQMGDIILAAYERIFHRLIRKEKKDSLQIKQDFYTPIRYHADVRILEVYGRDLEVITWERGRFANVYAQEVWWFDVGKMPFRIPRLCYVQEGIVYRAYPASLHIGGDRAWVKYDMKQISPVDDKELCFRVDACLRPHIAVAWMLLALYPSRDWTFPSDLDESSIYSSLVYILLREKVNDCAGIVIAYFSSREEVEDEEE